ncbi:MAG: DUF4387 domain-containing protein [Oscillospiraceae bacterium]|nr:DUF4387 domain-containing protein [Oscillospiraceae bacterium]MBR6208686.1 DUF4387 domain-containing protein [Oscillospiraceae bacterium]
MATIGEVARYVRSKNAGPFTLTIEIFADTDEAYEKICRSGNIGAERIASIFNVDPASVEYYYLPNIKVLKISMPRRKIQGHKYERDMHQGQQYVSLLDIEL